MKTTVESDGPVVDGRLLKDRPVSQVATGRFAHVPLMIGTNSDEGSLVDEATPADILDSFTASELQSLRAAYGGSPEDAALARAIFRDLNFTAPSRWIAARSSEAAPTFLYRFSYLRRTQRGRVPGASHGSEIPYVFDSWRQSPSGGSLLPAEDRAEASRLHACWMAFARTGVPQGPDVPTWPRYQPAQDELLDFDVTTTVRTVPDRAALTLLQKRVVP